MKMTDWYSGDQKPVRRGWYEVRNAPDMSRRNRLWLLGRPWRYWTGYRWMTASPSMSWSFPSVFGEHKSHQWRGIAK